MSNDLHVKYRPTQLSEVVGQDLTVKSLRSLKKKGFPHTFLLTGPSGTGKTTIARILAGEVGCSQQNIIEVDAATHTGIDAMRELMSTLSYQGFGESPKKFLIIDECHALSKQAWQAVLKDIEEPPNHVYFAFCTTDLSKIPNTIKTRSHAYNLREVNQDEIYNLLFDICESEEIELDDDSLDLIALESNGSPRQAIVYLSMCRTCRDKREVANVLETPLENQEVISFCRLLLQANPSWSEGLKIINSIQDLKPESVRIIVVNYLTRVLLKTKNEEKAAYLLSILDKFKVPFNDSDKYAPILLAFGDVVFETQEDEV